jgi:excisionase family DNA binding protein
MSEVHSVGEAAKRLGCSKATVYALCNGRHLRFSRVGLGRGKIVITDEAIYEYLVAREVAPQRAEEPAARVKDAKGFTDYYRKVMAQVAAKHHH